MKKNLYSKNLFIIDLFIVTVWGLFMCRYAISEVYFVFLFYLVRVALSFEMLRKSPWVFSTALTLGVSYLEGVGTDWFLYPIKRIVYYAMCFCGEQSEAIKLFQYDDYWYIPSQFYILNGLLLIWLIILPAFIGLRQIHSSEICWKKRGLQMLIGGYLIASCFLILKDFRMGIIVSGLSFNLIPFLYWNIYKRNKRSLVEVVYNDVYLRRYLVLLLFIILYICIGKLDISAVKASCLFTLPTILFILICKWTNIKPILTRYCVALSLGGLLLYWAIATLSPWLKIIAIVIAVGLYAYVAFSFIRLNNLVSVAVLGTTSIGNPVLLGLNPYVVTDVDSITKHHWNYSTEDGYFIIHKEDKVGLRDRYGIVLSPEYDQFTKLDQLGQYINVLKSPGTRISENRYGVYDIQNRRFILNPDSVKISEMILTGEGVFNLINNFDEHFATLYLPGAHPELNEFLRKPQIKPHYLEIESDIDMSVDYTVAGLEEDETQNGENSAALRLMNREKKKAILEFKRLTKQDTAYQDIYVAWYNLIEGMSEYLVYETYGEPYYSYQPLQFYFDMRTWYENFINFTRTDNNIISGQLTYTSSLDKDQKFNQDDINRFFNRYDSSETGGYNVMWNKIRPAYKKWLYAREKYADSLTPHQRLSLNENTVTISQYLIKEIYGLSENRNDNDKYEQAL